MQIKFTEKDIASLKPEADAIYWDPGLPGFGVRLRGGVKSWCVQYRHHGKTRRMALGDLRKVSLVVARAEAKRILAEVELGRDPQAAKQTERANADKTFAWLAAQYLKDQATELRPRSHHQATYYLTGKLTAPLHKMPVADITREDIARVVLKVKAEVGPGAATQCGQTLATLFSWGMRAGVVLETPCTHLPRIKLTRRDRVLDDGELVQIWKATGDGSDYSNIIRLLILTGQRREEIGQMQWSEIDLKARVWTLPGARSKNHREHTLPLVGQALDIIRSLKRRGDSDFVFANARHTGGFNSYCFGKEKLDAALVKVPPWRVHDLRRTFATKAAESCKIFPHIIEQILNHVGGHKAGVAGVYNHAVYREDVERALTVWSEHLAGLVRGERKIIPLTTRRAKM